VPRMCPWLDRLFWEPVSRGSLAAFGPLAAVHARGLSAHVCLWAGVRVRRAALFC